MSKNSDEEYVFYENDPCNKIRIHIYGGCEHSKKPLSPPTKNGRWHGPFDTLPEVEAERSKLASAKNAKIVDRCNICFPLLGSQ